MVKVKQKSEKELLQELMKKLDRIVEILVAMQIKDKDDKITSLKRMGFKSEEISPIVGIKNVRDTKGWKRK